MDGRTDIKTDGDYIKRVVHGPPGDHTLKNPAPKTRAVPRDSTPARLGSNLSAGGVLQDNPQLHTAQVPPGELTKCSVPGLSTERGGG